MSKFKRILSIFLALQFLFDGTSFSDNFVDFAICSVVEATEVECVSTNSDVIADTLEVDLITAESETAQGTLLLTHPNVKGKTRVISTNASAKRTKDVGGHNLDCEKARPKVSVIIPVYNVEPWIRECLDSIKNQTLREIEIICVNDGSTDKSGDILNEYAKDDDRFIIIHKKNNGVQEARNDGLARATGEYITFVDSDDYLQLDAYEVAYNAAKKDDADIVQFDYREFLDGKNVGHSKGKSSNDIKCTMISRDDCLFGRGAWSCWNKLVRSNLIKKHNLKFIKGLAPGDDTCFAYMILGRVKNVILINAPFYNYRIRSGSISQIISANDKRARFLNNYKMIKYVCNDWRKHGYSKSNEHVLLRKFLQWIGWLKPISLEYAQEVLDCFGPDIYNPAVVKRCDKRTQQLIRELEDAAAHPEKYQNPSAQRKAVHHPRKFATRRSMK